MKKKVTRKTVLVGVWLTPAKKIAVTNAAKGDGRSVSQWCSRVVSDALAKGAKDV